MRARLQGDRELFSGGLLVYLNAVRVRRVASLALCMRRRRLEVNGRSEALPQARRSDGHVMN
jgi:hypothetical protein